MRPKRRTAGAAGSTLTDRAMRRFTPREAARLVMITAVMARHVLPALVRPSQRNAEAIAPRVREAVVALGPPFIKLSQLVSSTPGLFPVPISEALRDLLDDAPADPWPAILAIVEADLGRSVTEAFESFEPAPIAAASIAQVHAARLHDGSRVVVKVRRPGVERRFRTDLRLLRRTARILERHWKAARVLNPVAVVDDVITTLRHELDFTREATAMERFEANLRAFGNNERIRVPAVHRELTTPAVLTMERIDGIKVDDLMSLQLTGFDLVPMVRAGVRAWIEAAMVHRFFHGDVHAGNLLVDGNGNVVFLDFGIMGELEPEVAEIVRRGVVALLHDRDFLEVTRCLAELGSQLGMTTSLERAAEAIRRHSEELLDKPLAELDLQEIFLGAVRKAAPHGVRLPRAIVLLAKQIFYFERYAKLVAPDYDILADTYLIEFMIGGPPQVIALPADAGDELTGTATSP